MSGRDLLTTAGIVIGLLLIIAPALFPIQPVLYHDTTRSVTGNETVLEQHGFEVVAYENLSNRGKELYVGALENDGEYITPIGTGAPEYPYPTPGMLADAESITEYTKSEAVAIKRPATSDLPPADERVYIMDGGEEGAVDEQTRQLKLRYDAMTTRTDRPPLTAIGSIIRLLSVCIGIITVGVGGYRRIRP